MCYGVFDDMRKEIEGDVVVHFDMIGQMHLHGRWEIRKTHSLHKLEMGYMAFWNLAGVYHLGTPRICDDADILLFICSSM